MTMMADLEPIGPSVERELASWHRMVLERLGWSERDAVRLCEVPVDLHTLEELLEHGCSRELAWRIARL